MMILAQGELTNDYEMAPVNDHHGEGNYAAIVRGMLEKMLAINQNES